MDFKDKKYIIGIDLGTTNSAVSYVDLVNFAEKNDIEHKAGKDCKNRKKFIKIFKIPQLTGSGEFSRLSVLPSFLYIPGEFDVSGEALKHPWKKESDRFAGAFARDHGSKIPSRLVSSAKSWLCHSKADRQAKILPWGSEGIEKVSPVTATAEYLNHIKKAWNHSVRDEDYFLENQFIIITVPASFDETARELTLAAAKEAGFGTDITLLEEPLAAFYAWLVMHENDWQSHVKPDDLIFVCDVGGGTSDFTLITLKESEGTPRFERLAVGDHLILGGDNIDLAIAGKIESKFKKHQSLTPDKWKTLCHKSRQAKERILEKNENFVRITLKGEGRQLIAGTLAADLKKDELENILVDGFFPDVKRDETLKKNTGKAITEFGLPYEQEPAITKHIVWFLEKHKQDIKFNYIKSAPFNKVKSAHLKSLPVESVPENELMPDLILFNGGSLKPDIIQQRIRTAIRNWFNSKDENSPVILKNPDPDLSVAIGAAYYGLVKQGTGVKVGSGSPRSYYLGISDKKNDTETQTNKALCIVERGLDEGSKINFPDMEFEVLANQPVSFDIFSSSFRSGDKTGDIIEIDDSLSSMAPVHTVIRFGKKGEKKAVPVRIEPEYTEMGTLAIWCRSLVTNHRWKLQFQLRDTLSEMEKNISDTDIFDDAVIRELCTLIDQAFSIDSADSDKSLLLSLVKTIENKIERKKAKWPLSLLRAVSDKLIEISDKRKLSHEHEARWLNLTGFCMRPGFGDAFDEERMRKLWKIYLAGPNFPKAKQNASEWWIFCRRIAAGLKAGQQRQFFQDISALLLPGKKLKTKSRLTANEITEIWMAAANMERLLVKDKVSLGRTLLSRLKSRKKNPHQLFWALSRIGAREMLYGSVDRVVPPKEVSIWIKKLLQDIMGKAVNAGGTTGNSTAATAAAAAKGKGKGSFGCKKSSTANGYNAVIAAIAGMARKTGDRTRDIDQDLRKFLIEEFEKLSAGKEYINMIKEKTAIESREEQKLFGESLPSGIVLKT